VYLLTNWRYWGYTFNPISYYFCFAVPSPGTNNEELGALVAMVNEVHNTPWNEMIHYVHPANKWTDINASKSSLSITTPIDGNSHLSGNSNGYGNGNGLMDEGKGKRMKSSHRPSSLIYHDNTRKMMHVSPFMQMEYTYIFDWSYPSSHWDVRWELIHMPQSMTPIQWNNKGEVSYTSSPSPMLPISSESQSRHIIASQCPVVSPIGTPLPSGHKPVAKGANSAASSPTTSTIVEEGASRDRCHMKVTMSLQSSTISQSSLIWILYHYPAMTVKATLGIYWEAFLLFARKGATFFAHPNAARRWD
jgi:DUF1365 family protein